VALHAPAARSPRKANGVFYGLLIPEWQFRWMGGDSGAPETRLSAVGLQMDPLSWATTLFGAVALQR